MAFDVHFYTFGKKERSTARPSGQGTVYSCTANDPLDLLAPEIILKISLNPATMPTEFNYAYIPAFSRYYRVTGWTVRDGLWHCNLAVDALASWKTAIGANTAYVYRAYYNFDGRLVDDLYPTLDRVKQLNISLPKIFSIGGIPDNPIPINSGYYFVTVLGYTGSIRYAMGAPQFYAFIKELYSDDFYDAILGSFGASQYPEAKVAINQAQYLSDIKWVPAPLQAAVSAQNSWSFPYSSTRTTIPIATVDVTPTGQVAQFVAYVMDTMAESTYTIIRDSSMGHPQADDRGDWVELSPYSEYELFYPPFGLIQLDPSAISTHDNINFRVYFDPRACTVQLEVTVSNENDTRDKEVVIYRNSSTVGVDIPFGAMMTPGTSLNNVLTSGMSGILSAAASYAAGNYLGAAAGVVSAASSMIGSAVKGKVPHSSSSGSFGSAAALGGNPALQITHWYLADDDPEGRGRPYCQKRQLSTLPGFIQAEADELVISGALEQEMLNIKEAVSQGFFYE